MIMVPGTGKAGSLVNFLRPIGEAVDKTYPPRQLDLRGIRPRLVVEEYCLPIALGLRGQDP